MTKPYLEKYTGKTKRGLYCAICGRKKIVPAWKLCNNCDVNQRV